MSWMNSAKSFLLADEMEDDVVIDRPRIVKSGHLNIIVRTPHSFADVKEYADCLMSGNAIMVSFDAVDATMRNRIFDYLNGVAYIVNASISMVSDDILVYAPSGVSIDKQAAPKRGVRSWLG